MCEIGGKTSSASKRCCHTGIAGKLQRFSGRLIGRGKCPEGVASPAGLLDWPKGTTCSYRKISFHRDTGQLRLRGLFRADLGVTRRAQQKCNEIENFERMLQGDSSKGDRSRLNARLLGGLFRCFGGRPRGSSSSADVTKTGCWIKSLAALKNGRAAYCTAIVVSLQTGISVPKIVLETHQFIQPFVVGETQQHGQMKASSPAF